MRGRNLVMFLSVMILVVAGCSKEEDCDLRHPDALLGMPALKKGTFPESDLNLKIGDTYEYAPKISSLSDVYYQWYMGDDDLGTEPRFSFKADHSGRSKIKLELKNEVGEVVLENRIIVSGADYTKGCLVINEGWYGHEPGSVSYYNFADNTMEQWAFKTQNFGTTLGLTTESATLWKGQLYICSKQENQLTIVDPNTLYVKKSGAILPGRMIYEFIGLNEQYGIVTANGDIFRVDLNTLKAEVITTGNTWSGCGSAVVYQGKLLLNVKGQKLYVMEMDKLLGDLTQYTWKNQFPFTTLDVQTNGGCRFVEGKDGNVYTVESNGKENRLVRIKPDLTLEKVLMRSDYSPADFGSYREAAFCGTGDVFFYLAGGKIYRATFAQAEPDQPFITDTKEGFSFYGAGIRLNPKTNELIAVYTKTDLYDQNMIVRFDGTTGKKISELTYNGYYFPATVIFN
ncbi:MAG: DUF5074 domain-containing protein [Odoribacter sp.]